jgi:signal transduction histidine kinase
VARLTVPAGGAVSPASLAYQAVLVAIAGGLLVGLLSAPWERAAVTDLVVELGEARSGTLRGELARALGDPTLEVGYWVPETGQFVDADGRPLSLPGSGSARSVTRLDRDGQPVAALVHDPSVLGDPGLLEAVSSAAQLAASNARLQAHVRAQVVELGESRRRLLEAGDEERRRLERRLHDGAEHRLEMMGDTLRLARSKAVEGARTRIESAEAQLSGTLEDLARLAQGLHPRVLSERGLRGALESLAARSEIPIDLEVAGGTLPPAVEATFYFVCSEALANVAKYARASRVSISVSTDGARAIVSVEDDGVGGANPSRGSGLRGLVDRVEAIGGTLRIESPKGRGTRLAAEIPVEAGTR